MEAKDLNREINDLAHFVAAKGPKKSYVAPRLVKYGDLQRLTATKGGTKGDGGTSKSRF